MPSPHPLHPAAPGSPLHPLHPQCDPPPTCRRPVSPRRAQCRPAGPYRTVSAAGLDSGPPLEAPRPTTPRLRCILEAATRSARRTEQGRARGEGLCRGRRALRRGRGRSDPPAEIPPRPVALQPPRGLLQRRRSAAPSRRTSRRASAQAAGLRPRPDRSLSVPGPACPLTHAVSQSWLPPPPPPPTPSPNRPPARRPAGT